MSRAWILLKAIFFLSLGMGWYISLKGISSLTITIPLALVLVGIAAIAYGLSRKEEKVKVDVK
ncbi:MAG TPA: hypothetical protein ENF57_02185 [Candidatus Korarchaeota archaeon]|nr:MAG: hypothetical protein DRO05_04055 [Candidatus Korarchaeota archaeon]HDI73801.1 hypothetical protein [Candidatus Korarchaeota archaeon]